MLRHEASRVEPTQTVRTNLQSAQVRETNVRLCKSPKGGRTSHIELHARVDESLQKACPTWFSCAIAGAKPCVHDSQIHLSAE